MPIIEIKWMLNGFDNVGLTDDGRVWRTPYVNGNCSYTLKEIKPHEHLKSLYFRIHKKRLSRERINNLCIKLEKAKIYTIPDPKDVPFKNI